MTVKQTKKEETITFGRDKNEKFQPWLPALHTSFDTTPHTNYQRYPMDHYQRIFCITIIPVLALLMWLAVKIAAIGEQFSYIASD